MRRWYLAFAALALLLAACGSEVAAQVPPTAETAAAGISVTGEGQVSGTPDTLTVDVGVSVMRPTVGEAVEEAARVADELVAALRSAGVEERDIQTRDYSIFPRYDYRNEREEILGYEVNNTLTIKIRELDAAGDIIDIAAGVGGDATRVHGVRFSLEDNEALVEEARRSAWEDAKAKAEQLAALAGVRLGAPFSISEVVSPVPPPVFFDERALEFAAEAATPIEPGELSVTVSISVQFTIER